MERIMGKRMEIFCECLAAVVGIGCWLLATHAFYVRLISALVR